MASPPQSQSSSPWDGASVCCCQSHVPIGGKGQGCKFGLPSLFQTAKKGPLYDLYIMDSIFKMIFHTQHWHLTRSCKKMTFWLFAVLSWRLLPMPNQGTCVKISSSLSTAADFPFYRMVALCNCIIIARSSLITSWCSNIYCLITWSRNMKNGKINCRLLVLQVGIKRVNILTD